ncbi:MAG: hypothetical protein JO056_01535, partial [Alphaproteobacteria bacterium]|nr:hypothetical protein [Alphaproteobacteria bacterium]
MFGFEQTLWIIWKLSKKNPQTYAGGCVQRGEAAIMKSILQISLAGATSIAAVLAANSAFAAQNVANTSQKGSLLVWPMITVDPGKKAQQDTSVEISNDANASVHVECEYVNERKGRVNFDFELSGKQTVSWDVLTGSGDQLHPPPFPTN